MGASDGEAGRDEAEEDADSDRIPRFVGPQRIACGGGGHGRPNPASGEDEGAEKARSIGGGGGGCNSGGGGDETERLMMAAPSSSRPSAR
jgi:hypothetical protein